MKTQVYSWRLSPERKNALQEAARERQKSLAELLETITDEWLKLQRHKAQEDDEAEQRRMHAEVEALIGSIRGDDPDRAAEASQRVRTRLREKHERTQQEPQL